MSWATILTNYAKVTGDPSSKLDAAVYKFHDSYTLTIYDKFPKAKYHYLILPRYPFPSPKVPLPELKSLRSLLASTHALQILEALSSASEKLIDSIYDDMIATHGGIWDVQVGFHGEESMEHVHCHVISTDFVSERLKNKKHWNSFSPEQDFFLPLKDVIEWIKTDTVSKNLKSKTEFSKILTYNLQCHRCQHSYPNLPKLKICLEIHLQQEISKKRPKPTVIKRSASPKPESASKKPKLEGPNPDELETDDEGSYDGDAEFGNGNDLAAAISGSPKDSEGLENGAPIER